MCVPFESCHDLGLLVASPFSGLPHGGLAGGSQDQAALLPSPGFLVLFIASSWLQG
jgi:hypothetical protein